jgi:hypothetical protein
MTITVLPLDLVIDDADGSVTIRLRSTPQDDDRPLTRRIPDYLRAHPHSTAAAVAEALGSSSPDSVSSTLSELKKRGEVDNAVDGHTTREWVAFTYVVAELDADGQIVAYLRGLAAKEFGPDVTHRLTPDLNLAWRFPDRERAQVEADRFNPVHGNPPLTVIKALIP